jgi:hypothetical protein
MVRAQQRHGLSLLVDREADREPALLSAQLLDCSRVEIRLLVATPLQPQERIRVRLRDESSGLQLDVAGAIAAQRKEPPDGWSVTCRFDHELDWETLGELFLCGILETAPR